MKPHAAPPWNLTSTQGLPVDARKWRPTAHVYRLPACVPMPPVVCSGTRYMSVLLEHGQHLLGQQVHRRHNLRHLIRMPGDGDRLLADVGIGLDGPDDLARRGAQGGSMSTRRT